jgi:hypothetical protein
MLLAIHLAETSRLSPHFKIFEQRIRRWGPKIKYVFYLLRGLSKTWKVAKGTVRLPADLTPSVPVVEAFIWRACFVRAQPQSFRCALYSHGFVQYIAHYFSRSNQKAMQIQMERFKAVYTREGMRETGKDRLAGTKQSDTCD